MTLPHAITAASVKMRFPAFLDVPDSQIEFAIEEAELSVDQPTLGDWYLTAFLYRTAHILMVQLQRMQSGTGQIIQSMNIGGEISFTYAPLAQATLAIDSDLTTTAFGLRFLEIIELAVPAVAII
jgi:hypothetical protein